MGIDAGILGRSAVGAVDKVWGGYGSKKNVWGGQEAADMDKVWGGVQLGKR